MRRVGRVALRVAIPLLLSGDDYTQQILAYNPVAFYDAGASQLWQDSARTTPATSEGDVVGAWDDLSGNGYHLTQATTALKPALRHNVINGRSVLRFSNDFLENTSFADFGDNYTMLAVAKYSVSADTNQGIFFVSTVDTELDGLHLWHITESRWSGIDASVTKNVLSSSDHRDDVWRLHSGHNTGSELEYWVNKVSQGTTAYTAPNPNTLSNIRVGTLAGGGWTILGDIATLFLVDLTLLNAGRENLEDIVNNRYRIF